MCTIKKLVEPAEGAIPNRGLGGENKNEIPWNARIGRVILWTKEKVQWKPR